jgi:hypothetical protein
VIELANDILEINPGTGRSAAVRSDLLVEGILSLPPAHTDVGATLITCQRENAENAALTAELTATVAQHTVEIGEHNAQVVALEKLTATLAETVEILSRTTTITSTTTATLNHNFDHDN